MQIAVPVEIDEADLADRLSGARDIDVEDRQRAGEIAAGELIAHVLRDEEAQPQRRADRLLNSGQRTDRAFGDVGNCADRLEAAHQIGRRRRKERVGVEKIGTAEHVVQRVLPILEMPLRPGAHPGELPLLERGPIVSNHLACRCQPGLRVSAVIGEPADGCMPARNRATSSGLAPWASASAVRRHDNDRASDKRGNPIDRDIRPLPGATF